MRRSAIPLVLLGLVLWIQEPARGGEVCIQQNGLRVCTDNKGFFRSEDIFGGSWSHDTGNMRFQVVTVRVSNLTTRPVSILPENFQGRSENGNRYVVDRSLHESINWRKKLLRGTLSPGQTAEGDLIFPVFSDSIRRLIHNGYPYFETSLY